MESSSTLNPTSQTSSSDGVEITSAEAYALYKIIRDLQYGGWSIVDPDLRTAWAKIASKVRGYK